MTDCKFDGPCAGCDADVARPAGVLCRECLWNLEHIRVEAGAFPRMLLLMAVATVASPVLAAITTILWLRWL